FVRDRLRSEFGYAIASLGVMVAAAVAARGVPLLVAFSSDGTPSGMMSQIAATFLANKLKRIEYNNTVLEHFFWLLHWSVMGVVICAPGPAFFRFLTYASGIAVGFSTVAMTAPSPRFLNEAG
ncbi:hypothetical protein PMAYCL1PPCAC_01364, partial [Pristionchus mayeri]